MSQAFESIKQGLQEAIEHAQNVVDRDAPGELLTLIGAAYQVIGILLLMNVGDLMIRSVSR